MKRTCEIPGCCEEELTPIQLKIFEKIKMNWEVRVGKNNVDIEVLKIMIKMVDTEGDGKKRITRGNTGEIFVVPIEDIFLIGVKEEDLDKYPKEVKGKTET